MYIRTLSGEASSSPGARADKALVSKIDLSTQREFSFFHKVTFCRALMKGSRSRSSRPLPSRENENEIEICPTMNQPASGNLRTSRIRESKNKDRIREKIKERIKEQYVSHFQRSNPRPIPILREQPDFYHAKLSGKPILFT